MWHWSLARPIVWIRCQKWIITVTNFILPHFQTQVHDVLSWTRWSRIHGNQCSVSATSSDLTQPENQTIAKFIFFITTYIEVTPQSASYSNTYVISYIYHNVVSPLTCKRTNMVVMAMPEKATHTLLCSVNQCWIHCSVSHSSCSGYLSSLLIDTNLFFINDDFLFLCYDTNVR